MDELCLAARLCACACACAKEYYKIYIYIASLRSLLFSLQKFILPLKTRLYLLIISWSGRKINLLHLLGIPLIFAYPFLMLSVGL